MSKTVATCIAETNLIQGEPQENVFFLTLSRKIEDFPNEFLRTARSTSPIQICAIFSTIGPDNLSAVLNLELNAELEKIVAACANQAVLDFDGFANQVINTLNVKVCNFAANKGTQFKTSMSMFVIEGDILRVIHVGITKAVLFRNNRIMLLTEEQTVAHRYVQMGAIQASEELTHPENMNLTQYLGKMPQEGPVNADKKVHLKLQDDDELFLMGVGLSRKLPSQMRNSIIAKPLSTEVKSKEIINAAVSYGLKAGLTLIDIKVESTFLLPGDAVINNNLKSDAQVAKSGNASKAKSNSYSNFDSDEDSSDTINFVPGEAGNGISDEEEEPIVNEKKEKAKTVIIPIVIFIVCIVLGFGVTFMIFNMKNLINFNETTTSLANANAVGSVLYASSDGVPVYSSASLDGTVIAQLKRGDVVTLQEKVDDTFSKVITANNVTGYILTAQLLDHDPTLNDPTTVVTGDPTPVPVTTTTETAASIETTAVQTDRVNNGGGSSTQATTATPTDTPTPTPDPNSVEPGETEPSPTPTDATETPSPTPDPNNGGSEEGGNGGGSGEGGENGGGSGEGGENGGGSGEGGENGGGSGEGGENGGGAGEGGENGGNAGEGGGDATV